MWWLSSTCVPKPKPLRFFSTVSAGNVVNLVVVFDLFTSQSSSVTLDFILSFSLFFLAKRNIAHNVALSGSLVVTCHVFLCWLLFSDPEPKPSIRLLCMSHSWGHWCHWSLYFPVV